MLLALLHRPSQKVLATSRADEQGQLCPIPLYLPCCCRCFHQGGLAWRPAGVEFRYKPPDDFEGVTFTLLATQWD